MTKVILTAVLALLSAGIWIVGCRRAERLQPPTAPVIPHVMHEHGVERTDPYYWLRDRDNPEVLAYLEAENTYTEHAMAHTEELRNTLYDEIVGRIKPDESSVPYEENGYVYGYRYEAGGEYPVHFRRPASEDDRETILLDVSELAAGHAFCDVSEFAISPSNRLMVYSIDTVGRRFYDLHFKDVVDDRRLPDIIPDTTGNVVWAADNRTVFYTKQDPETLRWDRVYRHGLGTDAADDILVFEETDPTFSCSVSLSKDRKFIFIHSSATLADEVRFLDASDPDGTWTIFHPRKRGHEYSVDHAAGRFFIRTNDDARNFRLMSTPTDRIERAAWREEVPHAEDTYLESFELFHTALVIAARRNGLVELEIRPWSGDQPAVVPMDDPVYGVWIGHNPEFESHSLRYLYTSLATPDCEFEVELETGQRTLLKQTEVLGDFDSTDYVTRRLTAPSRDGVSIPVSLVMRADAPAGPKPLLLYGYGSYGHSTEPAFQSDRLSLLDRGFVYAIAHVRGGQTLGRDWYEDGKLLKKQNTFNDFIDCSRFLIDQGLTRTDRLFAMGGSAGGLLIGAVVNQAPELYRAAIAQVPFVDVVTTMLDDEIPLTTSEYDEWGNPEDRTSFDSMLKYSPYDQVRAQDYPAMLVLAGLHDSQVQYWEPAKWVAKLRAMKTDDNLLLLWTNMDAGHGGSSGRFKQHEETALTYAFLLDQLENN